MAGPFGPVLAAGDGAAGDAAADSAAADSAADHPAADHPAADHPGAGHAAGAEPAAGAGPLVVRRRGEAAWLLLNRPERRNALDPELVRALAAAFASALADDRVRVIVLAGTGASFCAGADLGFLHECARSGRDPAGFLAEVGQTFTDIERGAKPVLAAVHGHVVAGGLELALACDVVVARAGTLIGDGHVRNGLLPAAGASLRLARRLGEPLARWLLLSGELAPAELFIPSGLVHSVLPADGFLAGVDELVRRLAAVPAPAQQRVKGLLHVVRDLDTDAALATERRVFGEHWQDAEMIRLLRRFSRDRAIADLPGHRA